MNELNESCISHENLELILRQYELYYYYYDEIGDYNERKDELLNLKSVSTDILNQWFRNNYPDDRYTKIFRSNCKGAKVVISVLLDGMIMISLPKIDRDSINYCILAIKDLHPHTIVLDLRDCTGGDVDSAIDFAARFINSGEICHNSFRNKDYRYYAKDSDILVRLLFILVNNDTASSAEILATTFYINMDNCIIIGSETFGKNIGQTMMRMGDNPKYIFSMAAFKWDVSGSDSSIFSNIGNICRTVLCKSDNLDDYLSRAYVTIKNFKG